MIEDVAQEIYKFRDSRDWKQFHNPKDLAISLSLEAAELLENFQWSSSDEAVLKRLEHIKEELADVFIYSILFADSIGVKSTDLGDMILKKVNMNNQKYPVTKSFGKKEKYTEL